MITWLQNNLEKHFRSVFIVLLVVIIVAFVFTIGAMPSGGAGGKANDFKFYEVDLGTEAKRNDFFQDANLSAYIQLNGMQMPQNSMQQYAFNRATALHLANSHSIPGPSKDQLSEFIQTLPIFQGTNGSFSAIKYSLFVDQMESAAGYSKGNISKVLGDEWRIQKIYDVLSGPSFVQPEEIIDVLKADKTEWTVAVATLPLSEYRPAINPTEEDLKNYYDNNSFKYATPVRRVVSYAALNAGDFQDQVDASDEVLQEYFSLNQSNYTKPNPDTEAEEKTIDLTFEEAKSKVAFDYKLDQAKILAQETALEIVMAIVDGETKYGSDDFNAILETANVELKTTAPFAQNETPIGTSWSRSTAATAFELSESRYFSDPIVEGDSTIVLFLDSEIESEIPDFYSVQDDIGNDYRQEELRRLQASYGEELQAKLSEEADSLESFKAAAEAAGLSTKTYENFTRLEPAEGLSPNVAYSLASLSVGEVTPMTIQGDQGTLTYVVSKNTPEITASGEDYDSSNETLKLSYERYVVSQYISELANDELLRSGLVSENG